MRSGADCQVKAKRSLSVIHSSLTTGSSPGEAAQHDAAAVVDADRATRTSRARAIAGVETRSNGRDRKRYAAPVSAPTGQIWMVLPEK